MEGQHNFWQNNFQRMSLEERRITRRDQTAVQHDYNFQHRFDYRDAQNEKISNNHTRPVTLEYRSSIASTASTTSRYSATSYHNSFNSPAPSDLSTPPLSRASTLSREEHNNKKTTAPHIILDNIRNIEKLNVLSPVSPTPKLLEHVHSSLSQLNVIDPSGCFVPCRPLPLIQNNNTTRHHFVTPILAMSGQAQASLMNLLFNYTDSNIFMVKEDYERTTAFNVDHNASLITMSQYTFSESETPASESYLIGLGQRLGITSILVNISMENMNTTYYLLEKLKKMMSEHTKLGNDSDQDHDSLFWSRIILVIDQEHRIDDQRAFSQRKLFLINEMPRIQKYFQLSRPLSVLFLSTQVYEQIQDIPRGADYKRCCQRILWQMLHSYSLCGRWGTATEDTASQKGTHTMVNILTEDDESSSSSDDDFIGPQVINYVDFKEVKTKKLKKQQTQLQRRVTRRAFQKLNCYDDDDGKSVPNSTKTH